MNDRDAAVAVAPPLGLPRGSVRALITLAVLGTLAAQLLRGLRSAEVLNDTVLLVLGYYFGTRGVSRGPEGPAEEQPLWLPRGTIRLAIVLGFGLLAYALHGQGRLTGADGPPPAIVLVGTFLLGHLAKHGFGWTHRLVGVGVLALFGHALALATLLVVGSYCLAVASGAEESFPAGFRALFLATVGFYMGKR